MPDDRLTRDGQTAQRPLILISNDDGIDSLGIHALASALDGLGDLRVVAPEHEQSAVGHAITVRDPLRATPREFEIGTGHLRAWAVSGTPADCVKLACWSLLDRPPDLVVSGINVGPNTAVNVMYSGTVSAATEATILGFPAVAVSHCSWKTADYEAAGRYARRIAELVLERGLPEDVLLNVNVPDLSYDEIAGIEVTRLARARWVDELDPRKDPFDRTYYWLAGRLHNMEDNPHNDLGAIERGFVSVTPLMIDLTAHRVIDDLSAWAWNTAPERVTSDQ